MSNNNPVRTIDTNVILRQLLNDHPDHSPRARALFKRVQIGEMDIVCPDTAIFEAVHILVGRAKAPRKAAAASLLLLIDMPRFRMDHKTAIRDALAFWVDQPALDFADCYHLALTAEMGMSHIYTFDKKMDRFPGVERVEPA